MWLWLIGFRHLWEGPFLAFTWRVSLFKLFKRVDLLSLSLSLSSLSSSSSFQTSWALLDTRGINRESPAGNTCRGELCRLGFSPGPVRALLDAEPDLSLFSLYLSLSLSYTFFLISKKEEEETAAPSFALYTAYLRVYITHLCCTALCCQQALERDIFSVLFFSLPS